MKRIFLIGYMGAGKTTIGKRLSKRLGLSFIDLDCYIENRYQRTVNQLFDERGEAEFRIIEQKLLHEVSLFEDTIISTGGGAPCFFDNMEFMNQVGTSIYLKVSVSELVERLEGCKHTRPLLKDKTKEELFTVVSNSLIQRDPFYMQASIVFDAEALLDETDVESMTESLYKKLL